MSQFNIKLEETLFYEKLFSKCDLQKVGKVSGLEAYKLFLKSGLSIDDLKKICEYCGANRLGFFGRSQFYIALKIISIAQAGNCIDENILQKEVIHSLPRFDDEVNEEALKTIQKSSELPFSIPPPPNKHHMRTLSGNSILNSIPLMKATNRYSYSSPISKRLSRTESQKESWDQFSEKQDTQRSYSMDTYENRHMSGEDNDEDEDDDVWDSCSEQDNKGLLDPDVKTDIDLFCRREIAGRDGGKWNSSGSSDGGGCSRNSSSSSSQDDSSFSADTDDDEDGDDDDDGTRPSLDVGYHDSGSGGYTLMAAVEGLAAAPALPDNCSVIPTATNEQLEYYTRCFQTLERVDAAGREVRSGSAIEFFKMHDLPDDCLDKILHLINITPDSQISLIEFSRTLHLITHYKTGYSIPDTLPENLLPVEFEQPDEPFSFDLSDGERPEVSNNYHISSMESSYSADGDSSNFDFTDVSVNRGWAQMKTQFICNDPKSSRSLKSIFKTKNSNSKNIERKVSQKEENSEIVRPRPSAKKSLSSIPSTVAPPPPPRFSVPNETMIRKISVEKGTDPCGDSFFNSSSSSTAVTAISQKENDLVHRKISEPSKPDARRLSAQETRKQLQNSMRELKSRNHILLRLNNEMTSELEELREQRVNLDLQLEYIKQSQIDIQ